jgi:thymidylate synthase (FAD)
MAIANSLKWKKLHPLTDQNAFICLIDVMGDDQAIVQAARASYDGFAQGLKISKKSITKVNKEATEKEFQFNLASDITAIDTRKDMDGYPDVFIVYFEDPAIRPIEMPFNNITYPALKRLREVQIEEDRHLTRYLMNHEHTTPFEMVTVKFMVQVPMDCWRQWIRHRTASVNEYSTRYMEALDFFQVTDPSEWRLQSTDNKQGSSGFLNEHGNGQEGTSVWDTVNGTELSLREAEFHEQAKKVYQHRLATGIAKEQARKDLPLSTYTRAYWQCNLRNIFHFLRLRMDSHAQIEIRSFANSMFEIIKQLCPVACEAFEDYVLHAKKFSRMEMEIIRTYMVGLQDIHRDIKDHSITKPASMTDREWKEFLAKLS